MERVLDRAFNKAHGAVHAAAGAADEASGAERARAAEQGREDTLRSLAAPMTAADVVERIDLAFRDGDFFRLLQLPGPDLDDLGRATWAVGAGELSRAYRKLSVLVHPDKHPGSEARQAFEQLNAAYSELRDPDKLAARLRAAEPELQRAAERTAATASVAERVELNAAAEGRKAKLRKEEARSFQQQIQEQMQRRQAEAALKKHRLQSSRYSKRGESEDGGGGGGGGGSGSSDDDYMRRQVTKKRKKPTFM